MKDLVEVTENQDVPKLFMNCFPIWMQDIKIELTRRQEDPNPSRKTKEKYGRIDAHFDMVFALLAVSVQNDESGKIVKRLVHSHKMHEDIQLIFD